VSARLINDAGQSVVALCGGVGGAKLVHGLAAIVPGESLTVIVNTGDDFEHFGLTICPDIDTVLYTLAGVNDRSRGWGRAGESWAFMENVTALGGESWFRLGDKDLATHIVRSEALRNGKSLSEACAALSRALGVRPRVVPMSDQPVRTMVQCDLGELAFQRYFVEHRSEPVIQSVRFDGADTAAPAPGVVKALDATGLAAVLVCPSNPYLSIDPILSIAGIREQLAALAAPVVAVSPIIDGAAVKGPTAKIMTELGIPVTSLSVVRHYRDVIDGIVIDRRDGNQRAGIEALGIAVCVTDTMMNDDGDKARLGREVLDFAGALQRAGGGATAASVS
jgi:LPPG:FO 2-phospho-L-lactate transferase